MKDYWLFMLGIVAGLIIGVGIGMWIADPGLAGFCGQ